MEPLHKRYGHFYDVNEDSSEEEKYAKKLFFQRAGAPPTVAVMAEESTQKTVIDQHFEQSVKYIVFDIYFGADEIASMPPPNEAVDGKELFRDKQLFAQAQEGYKVSPSTDFLCVSNKKRHFKLFGTSIRSGCIVIYSVPSSSQKLR